jgi:hypothetical protein
LQKKKKTIITIIFVYSHRFIVISSDIIPVPKGGQHVGEPFGEKFLEQLKWVKPGTEE